MNPITLLTRLSAALATAVLATACGGGGGSPGATSVSVPNPAPPANPLPTAPAECKVQLVADSTVAQGKTASASVLSCGAPLADVVWTQTGGPGVDLLARRSPTVAFDTSAPGTVSLRADVTLADGSTTSSSATIDVTPATGGSFVTVRADHAMRPQADTSLRAWPVLSGGESVSRINWTQTAGPAVTMNTERQGVLMFKAPAVTADTALRFRATMTTSSGRIDSDDVTVTLDRETAARADAIFDTAARVHPYRAAARYAPVLVRCVYDTALYYADNGANNLCPSSTLPLLQAEAGLGAIPSVEQIMGRVLVSHDFLGANFEQFLSTQDPHGDLRRLFGAATAIVIGSHVRPSFYTGATGAIYLDADYLWLTPAQRDVVTEVPDYRSVFDDQLNFTALGRMVRGNDYAQRYIGDTDRLTRSPEELLLGLGRLLYHELAHASDYVPPDQRALNASLSVWENIAPRVSGRSLPSDLLAQRYPLQSAPMKGLGQVMYMGATPTELQKSYTAQQVGEFFGADVASDDYAYSISGSSNSREDLAMLFEAFMMAHRHGVHYDVAYTNKYVDGMNSDQLIVAWGQRGRIAEPAIKPRIKLVLEQIAPWIAPGAVDMLPAPLMLPRGQTWGRSVAITPPQGGLSTSVSSALQIESVSSALRIESASAREARRRAALRRGAHHLPGA